MEPSEYQEIRGTFLHHIDRLRDIRDDLCSRDPHFVNGLPADVRQRMLLLDRESTRLRNPDLTIAFVGGFSAGKSSLVNAFLGRYLLPESTKVTTAVPTFIRSTDGDEGAELHYLSSSEVDDLGELYRAEIAKVFDDPKLKDAPFASIMESVQPLVREGRGSRLVEQFRTYHEQRNQRRIEARGRVDAVSLAVAQDKIRDETEAMFLDRVVLRVKNASLPRDVVLVDLPGVSVPNPRHREITFQFVREAAHAVIFVLMATRLFDKDEMEIMGLFRSGESRITDKTFWALNRWDSLSSQQQQQTISDFETKMREFAIPSGYQSYRTNALHGLISQLSISGSTVGDAALSNHLKDYEDALPTRYGGSHETAFKESQIPLLQKQVLDFLNDRLRYTALSSAHENAKANFCEPIIHHLRRAKESDDLLIAGELSRAERELTHERVRGLFEQRVNEVKAQLQKLRNVVAVKRSEILKERTKELVDQLREKIEKGAETDAFQIYQEIIAERELRKYPYHFEIEMRIVDNLNTMLKRSFRQIVRSQVDAVFQDLVENVQTALEKVREDVSYSTPVTMAFETIIRDEGASFSDRVEGVVMTFAAQLDELLLFKPSGFLGLTGGNEILDGLEKAARLGFENLRDSSQAIQESDFTGKTERIRQTLTQHYIQKVREYHERITHNIFPIVINNMQQIQTRLIEAMQSKYSPALEAVLAQETAGEFAAKRKGIEERSRRFRDLVDEIEGALKGMDDALNPRPQGVSAATFSRREMAA